MAVSLQGLAQRGSAIQHCPHTTAAAATALQDGHYQEEINKEGFGFIYLVKKK